MEGKGKITKKYESGKAIKVGNDIYTLEEAIRSEATKLSEGDEVTLEFSKKGTMKLVSKITKTGTTSKLTPNPTPEPKTDAPERKKDEPPKSNYNYNDPARVAQIQRGNALNAAASAAAGRGFIDDKGEEDPVKAAQWIKMVAQELLTWLKLE